MTDDNRDDDGTEPAAETIDVDLTPHGSSDYKVLGQDAVRGGAGVLGHNTATTGLSHGVRGTTDSARNGSAGLVGEATQGSGAIYGVKAVSKSKDDFAAALTADAAGKGYGISAAADKGRALFADSYSGVGVEGQTSDGGSIAMRAYNVGLTNLGGWGYGVDATINSYGDGTAGVNGTAQAASGEVFGIRGETQSRGTDAAGVYGTASASSGRTHGVRGTTASATTEAAGVYGEATQGSGWTYGVHAVNDSDYLNAAAVRAKATAGAQGLFAESVAYTGAAGVTKAGGETGVLGLNDADTNSQSTGYGVEGQTDSVGGGAAGVYGEATQSSGQTYGVDGITRSDRGNAAGVRARAPNGNADGVNASGATGVVAAGRISGVYAESTSSEASDAAVTARTDGATAVDATSKSGVGLDVTGFSTSADDTPTPAEHAARIYDESFTNSSVLAIQTEDFDPLTTSATNFITFYDGENTAHGAIEGDGGGNLVYTSGGADYAEYLPRRDPEADIEAGDVVGVVGGAISKTTTDADRAMVVSDRAVVAGNAPGQGRDARAAYEIVAFTGQVPVKVRGPVETGDLVVPSGAGDGTGVAVAPGDREPGTPIVGRAWAACDDDGVSEVTVAVGIDDPTVVEAATEGTDGSVATAADRSERHAERLADLERENDRLRDRQTDLERENDRLSAENQQLRERLADLESEVAALSASGSTAAPVDDD